MTMKGRDSSPAGDGWYSTGKRVLDLALTVPVAIVLSPVAALISLLVKRSDGGPVLYRATRVGRDGEPFTMFKFRTMVVDAESSGPSSTANDDPRITRVGAALRRTKLDELPQLLNVLRGDMSLVGPRPQVDWDVARYTDEERRLLTVRPGITDWASIQFSDEGSILEGEGDPDDAYDRLIRPGKIRLGLQYIESVSFRTDVAILIATLRATMPKSRR
ncbi:sugar transferase [Nocardioides hungaricus]